ncbi:MAG TPA: hypothetical protein VFO01_06930 [Trebonia sp.]|nr:hypothetical protein [Trebonia sp.]
MAAGPRQDRLTSTLTRAVRHCRRNSALAVPLQLRTPAPGGTLPPAQADDLARQIRELDVRIQQSYWEFELME